MPRQEQASPANPPQARPGQVPIDYDYICELNGPNHANHVLDRLLEVAEGLVEFHERASHPKELVALGIKHYRQTAFKPYRVIYASWATGSSFT